MISGPCPYLIINLETPNIKKASLGDVKGAVAGIQQLPAKVFETAGGNGHSRSNSLWWIATCPKPSDVIMVGTRPPTNQWGPIRHYQTGTPRLQPLRGLGPNHPLEHQINEGGH